MILSIDAKHVQKLGRRIDYPGHRLTWEQAQKELKEGEQIVILSSFRVWPWYGFVITDKKTFTELIRERSTEEVYAAGPKLLALQEKFVPYDGP